MTLLKQLIELDRFKLPKELKDKNIYIRVSRGERNGSSHKINFYERKTDNMLYSYELPDYLQEQMFSELMELFLTELGFKIQSNWIPSSQKWSIAGLQKDVDEMKKMNYTSNDPLLVETSRSEDVDPPQVRETPGTRVARTIERERALRRMARPVRPGLRVPRLLINEETINPNRQVESSIDAPVQTGGVSGQTNQDPLDRARDTLQQLWANAGIDPAVLSTWTGGPSRGPATDAEEAVVGDRTGDTEPI